MKKKKIKLVTQKKIITEYDGDDLIQSDNDQHTNNELSEEKDLRIERTKKYSRIGALGRKQKI